MTDTSAPHGSSPAPSRDYFAGDPRSNYARMKAGDFYISDDPKIFEEQQRATRLSAMFLAAYAEGVRDAAFKHGWRAPAGPIDWSENDWVLTRLLAVCSLARTLP